MDKTKLTAVIAELGLEVESEVVPWSKSRNANGHRSLNWKVTILARGVSFLIVDYSAGVGHAPSIGRGAMSMEVKFETEHGIRFPPPTRPYRHDPILPDTCDVIASLIIDAEAIDHGNFEDWAAEFGFDTDSRHAKAAYQACVKTGLAMRGVVGETGLAKLREACRDY